jgi:hypothetical protein
MKIGRQEVGRTDIHPLVECEHPFTKPICGWKIHIKMVQNLLLNDSHG